MQFHLTCWPVGCGLHTVRVLEGEVPWRVLAGSAAGIADAAERVLVEHGFAYLGTIRRDGTPRISAVEIHLLSGDLVVVLIPRTAKAADVRRDPRVTLQSPVRDARTPGTEVKMRGRLWPVPEASSRADVATAVETKSGWRPGPDWDYLALRVSALALLTWVDGDMHLSRWTARGGVAPSERRVLDSARGEYRLR